MIAHPLSLNGHHDHPPARVRVHVLARDRMHSHDKHVGCGRIGVCTHGHGSVTALAHAHTHGMRAHQRGVRARTPDAQVHVGVRDQHYHEQASACGGHGRDRGRQHCCASRFSVPRDR